MSEEAKNYRSGHAIGAALITECARVHVHAQCYCLYLSYFARILPEFNAMLSSHRDLNHAHHRDRDVCLSHVFADAPCKGLSSPNYSHRSMFTLETADVFARS